MKRLSTKHFIAVAVCAGLAACSPKTTEESLAQATQFVQSGQRDAAIIELKNAVSQSPDAFEPRLLLGQQYLATAQLDPAEKELRRALELQPGNDQAIAALAQVLYHKEQFDQAVVIVRDAQIQDASLKETASLFAFLAAIRSDGLNDGELLSNLLADISENDKALATSFQALMAQNIDNAAAILPDVDMQRRPVVAKNLQAMIAYQQADFSKAQELFAQQVELFPVINTTTFYRIDSQIKAEMLDDATKETEALLSINKEQPLANLFMARILFKQEQYAKALESAEKAVQNGLDNRVALTIAGVSAYRTQKMEVAYKHLNVLTAKFPEDQQTKRLFAQVQLAMGYTQDAYKTVLELDELDQLDANLISSIGLSLISKGNIDNGNQLLELARSLDPDNALLELNEAYIGMLQNEEGSVEALASALEKDLTNSRAWMYLAMAHLRNDDIDAALAVAERYQERDSVNGNVLMGVIYRQAHNPGAAIAPLQAAIEENPEHTGAHLHLIQVYDNMGEGEAAYATALKTLDLNANNRLALMTVAKYANQLGKANEAMEKFQALLSSAPGDIDITVAMAGLHRAIGEPVKAITLLEDKRSSLTDLGMSHLGGAYIQSRQLKNAESVYQDWRQSKPDNMIAALRLIGVKQMGANITGALRETNEAIEDFGDLSQLLVLKFDYLTKLQRLDDAKEVMDTLIARGIESPTFELNRGLYYLAIKDYSKADAFLGKASQAGGFNVVMAHSRAVLGLGDNERAVTVMENGYSKTNKNPIHTHRMAEFYKFMGLHDKSEAFYLELVANTPTDFLAWNNLANLQLEMQKYDAARESAAKALDMQPNNAAILDTMGWVEYQAGNSELAETFISSALQKAPDNVTISLHHAEVLHSLGQTRQAQQIINGLKDLDPLEEKALQALKAKL